MSAEVSAMWLNPRNSNGVVLDVMSFDPFVFLVPILTEAPAPVRPPVDVVTIPRYRHNVSAAFTEGAHSHGDFLA